MELDVKAVVPSASGWRTLDEVTTVTDWNLNILLNQDIWEVAGEEPKTYFPAPLEGGETLYLSQDIDSGYSSFYLDNPKNHHGFGGREIELDLYNGDTVVLKGPWSSNSGVVNEAIRQDIFVDDPQFQTVKEVTFYSHDWRSVGLAASLSVSHLRLLVNMFLGSGWHLAWGMLGVSIWYAEVHAPEPGSCPERRI